MAEVGLDELIERVRLESGLRNNAYYSSDQIVRYLNAGGAELYDLFTNANQHYVISTFDFTTTGPDDAIVELPEDFQQGHSLDIYPDTQGQTRTIRYLANWLNRNAFTNNVFSLGPGGMDPVYAFLGGNLRFFPPQCVPAAPFRLYYTPKWQDLAIPTTPPPRTVDLEDADVAAPVGRWTFPVAGTLSPSDIGATATVSGAAQPGNNGARVYQNIIGSQEAYTALAGLVSETFGLGDSVVIQQLASASREVEGGTTDGYSSGLGQWSIADANFTASDQGAVITAVCDSPNGSFSGQYTIATVLSELTVQVIPLNPVTGSTALPFSGSFTIDRRIPGTRMTLPGAVSPWSEYLVVYAAMAVNIDRQRPIGELERKLQALKTRVASTIGSRQEEPQQPPLTRGTGGWWDGFGWS